MLTYTELKNTGFDILEIYVSNNKVVIIYLMYNLTLQPFF